MNVTPNRAAVFLFRVAAVMLACFLAARYLLPILLPFALAYFFALATRGTAEKLHRKTGIAAPLLRVCLLMLCILVSFCLVLFLGVCLFREAEELLLRFGEGYGERFSAMATKARAFLSRFESEGILADALESVLSEASSFVFSLLSGVVKGTVLLLPRAFLFLLVTVAASFYFALDLHRVHHSVLEFFSEAVRARIRWGFALLKGLFLRYLRAYATLSLFVFAFLLFGFLLIGVRYAVLLAAFLTLFDLLPVFGVGCVLLPWSLLELAEGHGGRGFALLALFLFLFLARQIAEPRIVGKEMGLHPLLSLLASYAALRLFGVVGMIVAPIAAGALRVLFLELKQGKRVLRE